MRGVLIVVRGIMTVLMKTDLLTNEVCENMITWSCAILKLKYLMVCCNKIMKATIF